MANFWSQTTVNDNTNQLYKADSHECLMSLENKENNTVAEN